VQVNKSFLGNDIMAITEVLDGAFRSEIRAVDHRPICSKHRLDNFSLKKNGYLAFWNATDALHDPNDQTKG